MLKYGAKGLNDWNNFQNMTSKASLSCKPAISVKMMQIDADLTEWLIYCVKM